MQVRLMKQTSLGDYYLVSDTKPVTVRVSANYPSAVCLTCLTNECKHIRAVTGSVTVSAAHTEDAA